MRVLARFGPEVLYRGDAAAPPGRRVSIGVEPRDFWVGVFVAPDAVYVCPLPCLVVRLARGPVYRPFRDPMGHGTASEPI